MSSELGQEIKSTNFLFRNGPDAFVVVNFTKPNVPEITGLLNEARGARHVFVIVHGPVFPFDDVKYYWWYLLGNRKDSKATERREMRKLLASLNAIVLCGHTHTTEFCDWSECRPRRHHTRTVRRRCRPRHRRRCSRYRYWQLSSICRPW